MGDAKGLLCFLATLAACCVFSSGSEVRIRRSSPWRVTTIQDFPYSRSKVASPTRKEDWEGYIPDLLKKIGEQLHQSYSISAVVDGKYGIKDPLTNKWNGMIGEIVDHKADVAAAAITISDARKEAVDFTEPLMSIGAVVLLKKPSNGSIPFKSAQDLADQTDISFGAVKDGTTAQLIHSSVLPYIQKISTALQADPDLLLRTSEEGVRRVRSEGGRFAFITESATGEYWVNQKPCDLVRIEMNLPAREYAFAVAKGSPIKTRINGAINQLRENGEILKIRAKWWGEQCSSAARHSWGAVFVLPLFALVQLIAPNAELK